MNPMLRRKKSVFAFVLKDTKRGKVAGDGGWGRGWVYAICIWLSAASFCFVFKYINDCDLWCICYFII